MPKVDFSKFANQLSTDSTVIGSEGKQDTVTIDWSLTPLTWWCLGIILVVFLASVGYIEYLRRKDKLISERRSAEYLPTLVYTLGVLGTFLGITIGLLAFRAGA